MKALAFNGIEFNSVAHAGQPSLTMQELAAALYPKGGDQSVTSLENGLRHLRRVYRRSSDEFTASMTAVVEMHTRGGVQSVRVFNLRGAHLMAMLAHGAPRAKEFRRWVLDVLDQQAGQLSSLTTQFHEALADFSGKQAVASICGRGLRRWRDDKPILEQRIDRIRQEIQPSLLT